MKNEYLFIKVLMVFLLLGTITSLNAQRLVDVEVKVVDVEHNFQCCTDGLGTGCGSFQITNRPEPRWKFKDTYDDGSGIGPGLPASASIFNPGGGVDCGVLGVNQLLTAHTGICAERILVEIESWEDDSGLDYEYDDGSIFGINPDDNYSGIQVFDFDFLNNAENVVVNQTLTLANGYKATISIKWNSYEPALAPVPPICIGQPASIDVTSSLSSGATDFLLFSDPGLTNLVANGDPLVTGALSADATFYAVQTNGTCYSDATPVNISVLTTFTAPSVDDTDPVICAGDNVTMMVTSNPSSLGNTFEWFDNPTLTGSPLGSGAVYTTTGGIPMPTTYYVAEYNGTCYGTPAEINITLAAITPPPLASDQQTCINGQVTLTAFTGGANGSFTWYDNVTLTNTVSTLTPPLPDNPAGYSYWVTETDPITGCESLPTMITVTTDLIIMTPSASNVAVCYGESATLSASSNSSTSGSFFWYNDMNANDLAYAGNPFNTQDIIAATTYYVVENINGCLSAPVAVDITVNPKPISPTAMGTSICSGTQATLTATGTGGDIFWFSDASGLNQINLVSSNTYTTSTLFSTTTYYVGEINAQNCLSELTPVTVVVQPLPSQPSSSALNLCEGESGTLVASTGALNGMLTWYNDGGMIVQQDNVLPSTSEYTVTTPSVGTTLYYVSYTDTNGCESTWTTVAVNVTPKPLAPTGIADVATCEGSTATILAGSGTYNWYLNMADTSPYSTGQSFTTPTVITTTTSYYVTEVVGGCESDKEEVVVMVQMSLAAPNISSNSPVCQGDDLMLSVDDPINPAYTYTWTDPNGMTLTSPTFTTTSASLNSGTYILTIEDANGCSATSSILVEVLVAPQSAPLFSNSPVCSGNDIELSTSAVTGAMYTWSGPGIPVGTMTAVPTYTVTGATSANTGNFTVSIDTGAGCNPNSSTTPVIVTDIPVAPTAMNMTVCQGEDVVLTATGSGTGILNYYLMSGSPVSPIIGTGLAADTYDYMVTEVVNGCESAATPIMVTVNAQPAAPITNNIEACAGETIALTAIATGTMTWSENADGSNPIADPSMLVLGTGTYIYYVTQTDGSCTSQTSSLVVTVVDGNFGTPTVSNIEACEGETVVLSATAAGSGALTYYDASGSVVSPNLGTSLTAGTYTYTVTEGNGECESITPATIVVTIVASPVIGATITNNSPLCEGETLTLDAPTMAGVDYFWTGPNGLPVDPIEDPILMNVSEGDHQGTYTLVMVDQMTGCESTPMSTYVQIDAAPTGISAGNDGPNCAGNTINLTATGIFGATYEWKDPSGTTIGNTQNVVLNNVSINDSGLYTVAVTIGDCVSTDLETLVSVDQGPTISAGIDQETPQGGVINLTATGAIGFTWSPANEYLSNSNSPNPTFSGAPIGVYTYTVTGYDANGCSSSDEVTVTVIANDIIEIVDLFTPNGDGVNDTWTITYLENLKDYTLKLYARGGVQILETSSYANDWDGTFEGNDLPDGTYWYVIKAESGATYKGAVTIKR